MSAPLTVLDILPLLRRIADAPDLLNDNADFDGIGARIEDVDELRRIVREEDPTVALVAELEALQAALEE